MKIKNYLKGRIKLEESPYLFLRISLKLHNQDSVVVISLVRTYVKTNQIVHFNHVPLLGCQLYLSKAVKNDDCKGVMNFKLYQ